MRVFSKVALLALLIAGRARAEELLVFAAVLLSFAVIFDGISVRGHKSTYRSLTYGVNRDLAGCCLAGKPRISLVITG